MKKFDRLPPEKRKEEIRSAAISLFNEKGFAKTTMENIVERVSLSKGGVYRLYSSTTAILSDIIINGMLLRNDYYEMRAQEIMAKGKTLSIDLIIDMIAQSLLLYPEISNIYVEFLWEKKRNTELQKLYAEISKETVIKTNELIKKYCKDSSCKFTPQILSQIELLMNSAILSMNILSLENEVSKEQVCMYVKNILNMQIN